MGGSYQVIARRWRPQSFADLVGQDHIVQTLQNAIRSGRIAHAYLFVGPRGTGKTSTARVFAKALNASGGPHPEPPADDPNGQAIMDGTSLDVIEIDAASNTGVDNVRELRESCQYAPASATFKIYIIDEVHMLSTGAFNALLKTLEEPPAHVKFIFATTEAQKVLPTIVSRCQRFEFRPMPDAIIVERLEMIAKAEDIEVSVDALAAIARLANGGMRDAQSIFDQMISFCGKTINAQDVLEVYGLADPGELLALAQALASGDYVALIQTSEKLAGRGCDLSRVLADLQGLVRASLMDAIHKGGESSHLGTTIRSEALLRMLEALQEGGRSVRTGLSEKANFEVCLLKALDASRSRAIDTVLRDLTRMAQSLPEVAEKKTAE